MRKIIKNFLYYGVSQNSCMELSNKIFVFNFTVGIYTLISVPFVIIHFISGNFLLFSFLFISMILLICMRFFLVNTKKHNLIFLATATIATMIFLLNFITGGIDNNGILWYYTFPMTALILLGLKQGTIFSISLPVISIILLVEPFNSLMMTVYDPVFLFRILITYTIVFLLAFVYQFQKEKSQHEIKKLKGFLPICSNCKKIRDDKGYWKQIEEYIQKHSDASFSHGICPDCSEALYGDKKWFKDMKDRENW